MEDNPRASVSELFPVHIVPACICALSIMTLNIAISVKGAIINDEDALHVE